MKKRLFLLCIITLTNNMIFSADLANSTNAPITDNSIDHTAQNNNSPSPTKKENIDSSQSKKTLLSKNQLINYGIKQTAGIYALTFFSMVFHECGHLVTQAIVFGPKTIRGVSLGCYASENDYKKMAHGNLVINLGFNAFEGQISYTKSSQYQYLSRSGKKIGRIVTAGAGPAAGISSSLLMLQQINNYEKDHELSPLANLPMKVACLCNTVKEYSNLFSSLSQPMKESDGTKICSLSGIKPRLYNACVAGIGATAVGGWIYKKLTSQKAN